MTSLLLADVTAGKLDDTTAQALTAAKALGEPVDILVVGTGVSAAAETASKLDGAAKVLVADDALYEHALAEPLAALITALAANYGAVVASVSSTAKNVLPRVAALLDVMQISEITKVIAPDTFERPIYAGNALQTVRSRDAKKVITVRTSAFAAAGQGGGAAIEALAKGTDPALVSFKSEDVVISGRPALSSAKVVISGGRGLESAENFKTYIEPVADALNAAIGCSRAAADAGYAPNDWQVGQTGKIVAPDLYIAAGIAGAIQHVAGMRNSKVIVAINKDPEAPIFQIADYAIVDDLFTVLPALKEALAKR